MADWRIGARVTPTFQQHPLFKQTGMVLTTYPNGHDGLLDPLGILHIQIDSPGLYRGLIVVQPASEWQTV